MPVADQQVSTQADCLKSETTVTLSALTVGEYAAHDVKQVALLLLALSTSEAELQADTLSWLGRMLADQADALAWVFAGPQRTPPPCAPAVAVDVWRKGVPPVPATQSLADDPLWA